MRADFYMLEKSRFREQPLRLVCELTRKALAAGQPTAILVRDMAAAEELDDLLWSFEPESMLPHRIVGLDGGDDDDDEIEVLIVPPDVAVPARPLLINLRGEPVAAECERVLEVVAADRAAREGSRERWRAYRARGAQVTAHEM